MGEKTEDLAFGLTGGTFRTEILGSHRIVLEGMQGILALSEREIGLRAGRQQVWVRGSGLRVVRVTEDGAVLSGRIEAVEFR